MNTRLALLVALGVGLTVFADALLKESTTNDVKLMAGITVYAATALIVANAFRFSTFGQLFIVWEASTVIAGLIVGRLVFGEVLSTSRAIAAVLAIIAVFLAS